MAVDNTPAALPRSAAYNQVVPTSTQAEGVPKGVTKVSKLAADSLAISSTAQPMAQATPVLEQAKAPTRANLSNIVPKVLCVAMIGLFAALTLVVLI
jgi:hypothetical protein